MDLFTIGKFIAERRKSKNLTQLKLSEILCVSEKTISKWECGKGFPDASLILPLCNALEINANELLSGKRLTEQEYRKKAEENLLLLKNKQQIATKNLLTLEYVIGFMSTITYLILILTASFFVENNIVRILLIVFGFLLFFVGIAFSIKIERDAGFYECQNCFNKYIPTYKSVLFSMHYGRTRYMKCPKCGKRTWNKKRLTDD